MHTGRINRRLCKDGRNVQGRRFVWITWILFLFLTVGLWMLPQRTALASSGEMANTDSREESSERQVISGGGQKSLTITVVDDVPMMDIEENNVPLAAFAETRAERGARHALWMGVALLAVVAYIIYFTLYDRKLYHLRCEVVQAEYRRMKRHGRRGSRPSDPENGVGGNETSARAEARQKEVDR